MRYRKSHWGVLALFIGVVLSKHIKHDVTKTTDSYRLDQLDLSTETDNKETIDMTTINNEPEQNNDGEMYTINKENNQLLNKTDVYNLKLSKLNDSILTSLTNAQESAYLHIEKNENRTNVTLNNINKIKLISSVAEQEKQDLVGNNTNKAFDNILSNTDTDKIDDLINSNKSFDTFTYNQSLSTSKTNITIIHKTIDFTSSNVEEITTQESETNTFNLLELFDYSNSTNFTESEGIERRLSPDLFLPLSEEEEFSGSVQPREVEEAADYGLRRMNELVKVTEPQLYKNGLWIDIEGPAGRVAAFSAPRPQVLTLARYGYATLQASTRLLQQLSENGAQTRQGGVSRLPAELRESLRGTALHAECPVRAMAPCRPAARRYRTADGTCNNAMHPRRGAALTPQQRFLAPQYQDGIQTVRRSVVQGLPLPSARLVSTRIHRDRDVEATSLTLLLMQWGQFVDHDLTATPQSRAFNGSTPRCCTSGGQDFQPPELMHPECLPIPVPSDDWFLGRFNIKCIEFIRSAPTPREECDFGYRQQLNQVTSYLDASPIYGSSVQQSDSIRVFRDGLLQYGRLDNRSPPDPPGGELCRDGALTSECFRSGDVRSGEQPALTALHITWVRKHNQLANALAVLNRHWSDEKVYQETRRIIGAMVQHITYREFLPIILGHEVMKLFDLQLLSKGYYTGYDPKVNPSPANSFTAAAYRFGHSMVQNSFVRNDRFHRPLFNNVSLHDEQTNPENIWSFGSVDRLLLGMINQPAQRRDEFISDELTNHLFQPPGFPFGMDLGAINIQRGRDHGLAPYTSWRTPCGLTPIKNWTDLQRVMSIETVERFRSIYLSVDDIDLFSAGLAEKPVRGGIVGPTFACIIAQQFLNLRKGDRFWYENGNMESSFTPAQLQQLRRTTLAQILCESMPEIVTIQTFVLLTPDNLRNQRQPCRDLVGFDLNPWVEKNSNANNFPTADNTRFKRSERKRKRPNRRKPRPKPGTVQETSTTVTNNQKKKQVMYYGTNTVTINHTPDYQPTRPHNYYEHSMTGRPTYNNYQQDELTLDVPMQHHNNPYILSSIQKQPPSTTPNYKFHIQINYFYNSTDRPDLLPSHLLDTLKPHLAQHNIDQNEYNRPTVHHRPVTNNRPTSYDFVYNRPQTNFDQNVDNYNTKPLYYDIVTRRPQYDLHNYQHHDDRNSQQYPHNVATSHPITILDTKPPIHLKPQTVSTKRPNIYILDQDNGYDYQNSHHNYRPPNFDYVRPADTHGYRRPISAHINKLDTKPVVIFTRPQLSKQDEDKSTSELQYDKAYMDYPNDRKPDGTVINIDQTIKLPNDTKYLEIWTYTNVSTTARPIQDEPIFIPVSKVKGYTTSTNSLDRVYVNVQQKEGDDDLEMTYDDLVEVYAEPDEGFTQKEDTQSFNRRTSWKVYNETTDDDIYNVLTMPEPNFSSELCSAELPTPMKLFVDDDLLIV